MTEDSESDPLPPIGELPATNIESDNHGTYSYHSPAASFSQPADSPPSSLPTSDADDDGESIPDEEISWDHVPIFDHNKVFSPASSLSLGSSSNARTRSASPINDHQPESTDGTELSERSCPLQLVHYISILL